MHLSYGGVEFKILRIGDYVREAVYTEDQSTFLFDHLGIRCFAWVNVGATNVSNGGVGLNEVSLVEILHQDRQTLKIWMDSQLQGDQPEVLLVSPYDGAQTDATFGPKCVVHGLNADHGNGSLVLDLEFHTDIAACGGVMAGGDQTRSAVLSNRWTYRVTYDEETYAEIRVVDGEAIFRMDALIALLDGLGDQVREFLIPPSAKGFQREAPMFELAPGGNALRYVITDRQVARSFPNNNVLCPYTQKLFAAAHIEIEEIRSLMVPSGVVSRGIQEITRGLEGAWSAIRGTSFYRTFWGR